MGEHIRQAFGRGQPRGVHRRSEQPQPRLAGRGGGGLEDVVTVAQLHRHALGAHHRPHMVEVLRELVDVAIVASGRAAQQSRRHRIGAGRAADAEVDAARCRRFQQRELLGDRQRRMVGQHHAAGAQPQLGGLRRQVGDQHRRAGGADRRHVVVFGHPVAGEPQPVGGLRQTHGGRQRVCGGLVGADWDEIEDRKPHGFLNAGGQRDSPASAAAWAKISSSISGVSLPVKVFCWLG